VQKVVTQKIIAFCITVVLTLLIFFIFTPPSGVAVHLHPGVPSYTSPLYNTSKTVTFNNVELTIKGDEAIPVTSLTFSIRRNGTDEEIASVQFYINGTEKPDSDPANRFTVINITNTSNLPYEENGSFNGYDEQTGETANFGYGYGYTMTVDLTILYKITYTTHITGTLYGQLLVNSSTHLFTSGPSTPFTVSPPPDDTEAPLITNITTTPSSQLTNGSINITATITDNLSVFEHKIRITGPAGYTPLNISMTQVGGNTFYYNTTYTIIGTYTYSLWAKDTSNNSAVSTTHQFIISAHLTITTLLPRWNFISIPFNQTISKTNLIVRDNGTEYTWTEAINAGLLITTIFQWNRTIPQAYRSTSILTPGYGYWIYAYQPCELSATSLNPNISTNYITTLSIKWNAFGVPVNQPVNKTSLIVNYQGNDYNWTEATTNDNPTGGPLIVKDLFGWNETTTPQRYIKSNILDSGYCYWIYSYYPCMLKRIL
jgi:hypothetical protein